MRSTRLRTGLDLEAEAPLWLSHGAASRAGHNTLKNTLNHVPTTTAAVGVQKIAKSIEYEKGVQSIGS